MRGFALLLGSAILAGCTAPQAPAPRQTSPAPEAVPRTAERPSVTLPSRPPIGGYADRFDIIRNEGSIEPLPLNQVPGYLDLQQAQFERIGSRSDFSVGREEAALQLTMPGTAAFAVNSAVIGPVFRQTLDEIAKVLGTYQQSYVDVIGHTDSTGSDAVNLEVSQRRAASVANYLAARGVKRVRIATRGAGEREPVATNETEEGRALNRRVDIRIIPVTATGPAT
ncbi:hypothetical protein B5C34_07420 [Pacificimonas flava]|uniref:OmpA-like domain-containing protein n=2 Tax=Pacificimonas TaxID=1960290 RepID=A0A219B4U6_9SPHN|nr:MULTISPECIES: OmpA family protein [Pacificimonas]MBZ6379511.1 OmpA family protein [Pacificimonas aurantium]OWV33301.1 hypothetical protein B5C34_07420 [Pacificimonas flava]